MTPSTHISKGSKCALTGFEPASTLPVPGRSGRITIMRTGHQHMVAGPLKCVQSHQPQHWDWRRACREINRRHRARSKTA